MKTTRIETAVQVLVCSLAVLALTGCYIQSDLTLTANEELQLNRLLLSIDSGPEVIEASIRHAFSLMGISDDFHIREYNTGEMTMEDYLLLTPTKQMVVPKSAKSGDKITITPMGEKKKFEWILAQRAQAFARKLEDGDTESANKVFLVVRITFPGPVDMANTSESKGNTYTWRISQGQLAKPFKITAIYK